MSAMLYSHVTLFDTTGWRWPNFSAEELACPCCGEYWHDPYSLDLIQETRNRIAGPLKINSAHRCPTHNEHVDGTPMSEHKKIAFDISLNGHDRFEVHDAAKGPGFSTFGFYKTFIHTDRRPGRQWYGDGAKALWNG